MTLDLKMRLMQTWNPDMRLECFERYHTLIEQKKKDGHNAVKRGEDLDKFITYDLARFTRYVKMWHYYKTLQGHGVPNLHHVAQRNKLTRYQHGCGDKFP